MAERIKLGMVGGGKDAFIGAVHRIASRIDDNYELVAGAFSSTPEKSIASGKELGVAPERCYSTYQEMAEKEAARADGIDVVAVVTPNHVHYPASKAFIEQGINVICDKPLTSSYDDALEFRKLVRSKDVIFVLTHNYSGYPLVREARQMVAEGKLGKIRLIQSYYVQDWLTEAAEKQGVRQAEWRTDPRRSGIAGCVGDIGTHAAHLSSYITGLKITEVAAELTTFVEGRLLDDNAHMMLHYEQGAKGTLWCSQVAVGHENDLVIKIYGDKGALVWHQENPNELYFTPFGEAPRKITRAGSGAVGAGASAARTPSGHPEGYLEGFAQVYTDTAELIRAKNEGRTPQVDPSLLPGIDDGLAGMKFIVAACASSSDNGAWTAV